MRQKFLKIADFIRLLDETGTLSLSNIALWVVLVKMAFSPSLSLVDAAVLLPVVSNYSLKRYFQRRQRYAGEQKTVAVSTALEQTVAQLSADVEKLRLSSGFRSGQTR